MLHDHSGVYEPEEFIGALHSDLHLLHMLGENAAEMHWILSTWGGTEEKERREPNKLRLNLAWQHSN